MDDTSTSDVEIDDAPAGPAAASSDSDSGSATSETGGAVDGTRGDATGDVENPAAKRAAEEAKRRRLALREAEAERDRIKAERDQVLEALRKLIDPDSAKPEATPDELVRTAAQERDQARAEARAARLEAMAGRVARGMDVDEEALMDSRAFQAALAKIDPTDEDFRDQVEEAIVKAVESNPRLRTDTGRAGETGPSADMTGGGEAPPSDDDDIEAARAAIRKRRGLG